MTGNSQSTTFRLWIRFITGTLLVAILISALLVASQISSSDYSRTKAVDTSFIHLADAALNEEFVATYEVTGNESLYLFTGRAFVAQIPYPPRHKMRFNSEGYAPPDAHLSYVLTETNGGVVQWIENGGNVSWCIKLKGLGSYKLQCEGQTPYIPSNGFALESVAYVPVTAMNLIDNYLVGEPKRTPPVVTRWSKDFGQIRCLLQTSGGPHLSTCINHRGIIVSSFWRNRQLWGRATLLSLGYQTSPRDFNLLGKPTGHIDLPPV
jgi:hypothetical protein